MKNAGILLAMIAATMGDDVAPGKVQDHNEKAAQLVRDVLRPAMVRAGEDQKVREMDVILKLHNLHTRLDDFVHYDTEEATTKALQLLDEIIIRVGHFTDEIPINTAKKDQVQKMRHEQQEIREAWTRSVQAASREPHSASPFGPFGSRSPFNL